MLTIEPGRDNAPCHDLQLVVLERDAWAKGTASFSNVLARAENSGPAGALVKSRSMTGQRVPAGVSRMMSRALDCVSPIEWCCAQRDNCEQSPRRRTPNPRSLIRVLSATSADALFGITEVELPDDASGDPINLTYLQTQMRRTEAFWMVLPSGRARNFAQLIIKLYDSKATNSRYFSVDREFDL